jgi:biotin operon repressor
VAKQKRSGVLARWQKLDLLLYDRRGSDALTASQIARKLGVSKKTVRRDLQEFRDIGQDVQACVFEGQREYGWCYAHGVRPLFTCNLKRSRERSRASGELFG